MRDKYRARLHGASVRLWLALAYLTIALLALPGAAQARRQCGSFDNGPITSRGRYLETYYSVAIVHGHISCAAAKRTMRRWETQLESPRGWRCHYRAATATGSECRSRSKIVRDYFWDQDLGPTTEPSSPYPGDYYCPQDVKNQYQTETATGITTHNDTCARAYGVARSFMDSPDCAINFQSASDYSCDVYQGDTYYCTGTIHTARQSDIACSTFRPDRRVSFSVVSP